jgi:hypothetical protein
MNEDSDNDTAAYHSTLQLLSPDTAYRQLPAAAVTTPTTTTTTAATAAAAEAQDSTTDPSDKPLTVALSSAADVTRRRGSYEYNPTRTPEKSILVVTTGSSNGEKRNAQQSNGSSSKHSSPKQRHTHSNSSRKARKNISWGGVEELDVDDDTVDCTQVSLTITSFH